MTRHRLTRKERSRGGRALADKEPPDTCPRCGEDMTGRCWYSYIGHLGLHGFADNHFDGDTRAAQRQLRRNGRAVQNPSGDGVAYPIYVSPYGST